MAATHRARHVLGCSEEEARARGRPDQGGTRPGLSHRRGRRVSPVRQSKKARQETGGLPRCEDLAAGDQMEESDIEARVTALEELTTADLRIEWRRLYRVTPPTRLSRDLLIRGVAYKVQERAQGGLSLTIKRRLRTLSEGSDR